MAGQVVGCRHADHPQIPAEGHGDHVTFQPLGQPDPGVKPKCHDVHQRVVRGDLQPHPGVARQEPRQQPRQMRHRYPDHI